jgi:hypothetical protein
VRQEDLFRLEQILLGCQSLHVQQVVDEINLSVAFFESDSEIVLLFLRVIAGYLQHLQGHAHVGHGGA